MMTAVTMEAREAMKNATVTLKSLNWLQHWNQPQRKDAIERENNQFKTTAFVMKTMDRNDGMVKRYLLIKSC